MPSPLERQLEQARAANATLKAQIRVLAFREAGIDTATGIGKAVAKFYDGPSDADAIRAFAATEFGDGEPPTTTEETSDE